VAVVALGVLAGAVAAQEGVGRPLHAVHFTCDAWFDEPGIRALLPLTPGAPLTAEQLAESRRLLELSDVFREIEVDTRVGDGGGAIVTFRLKRKRVVTEVRVRGYDALKWRDAYRLVRIRTGSFYDPDAVVAANARLRARYAQMGYPHAAIDSAVRLRPGEAELTFTIEEGPPVVVAAVAVTGDTRMPANELEHALRRLVGKPHRRDGLREGERMLRETLREAGYYEAEIDGEWVPSDTDAGVLWFTIDAGARTEVEIIGNEARSRKQLLGLMDLSSRLIVTDGTWRELARRIKREYQEQGYYRARVFLRFTDGDPRQIRFRIEEGRRYTVRRVDFSGNTQLSSETLRDELNTRPGRWLPWPRRGAFVRAVFDEDLRRLWYFYREQAFEDAEIVDAPVDVNDETGAIDVTVVIDEGPRTMVEAVRPPDLSGLPPALQEPALVLVPGEPLLPADLAEDSKTIQRTLQSDGYSGASVEPVVTRRKSGDVAPAVVDWTITRGPRREIGTVIVQGNVETYNETILSQLPFESGDPLDFEVLQRGQDKIYQLGTYRSVGVRPIGAPAEVEDVGIAVVPRPSGSIQWGAGYNTRDGITGFGEISYDNVGHRARRISVRGQGSVIPNDLDQTQFLALISFREPSFLGSAWQWNSELVGERSTKTINQYSILRGGFGNGLSRDLLPRLKGGIELQLEYADTFDVAPQSFLDEDEGDSFTTAISPFLIYDGRNDPFAPTSGIFDSVRLRYAPPGVSTVQFGKINLQHSQAFPLANWLSFIYSARVGYGNAFSGAEVLPIRERFFLGGATTVRGFSENSLGPTDQAFNVLGGDLAMVLSFELRVPVIYQLSFAVFNDNGGLFLTQCDAQCEQQRGVFGNAFTAENFRHSVGPGLRYMTPVGPISLDYGFKLDRRGRQVICYPGPRDCRSDSAESIGEVHFSISGTF